MNNKKLWIIIFTLLLVLAACGQNQSSEKDIILRIQLSKTTDHNNNTHTYHRIISLIPSNTEILYRLGLEKNIIGVSTVDDYPKRKKIRNNLMQ